MTSKSVRYTIIGSGRLSRHLQSYLTSCSQSYKVWSRKSSEPLFSSIEPNSVILLAISDSSLDTFFNEHLSELSQPIVHFSGVHTHPKMIGCHPLMTFGPTLYDSDLYQSIPFVVDSDTKLFRQLFPAFRNPCYKIAPEQKMLYHALCSLCGNISTLLWEHVAERFKGDLKLSSEILNPFLKATAQNLVQHFADESVTSVLTGPLVRQDWGTVSKHLNILNGDIYSEVYKSAVVAYIKQNNLNSPAELKGSL